MDGHVADMVQRVQRLVEDDPELNRMQHDAVVIDLGLYSSFGSHDHDQQHPKYELYWARRCELLMKTLAVVIAELTHFPKG
jgi:hypothetical protein